jgi:hypothetical protein
MPVSRPSAAAAENVGLTPIKPASTGRSGASEGEKVRVHESAERTAQHSSNRASPIDTEPAGPYGPVLSGLSQRRIPPTPSVAVLAAGRLARCQSNLLGFCYARPSAAIAHDSDRARIVDGS